MKKKEFLTALRARLSGIAGVDVEGRLDFYSEMIDDRMEDGLCEEDAVGGIGTVDEIAEEIISETPLSSIVREKIKPKKALSVWVIVLLVLGSPIWLSLGVAAVSVALSLCAAVAAVLVAVWAVAVAVCAFAPYGVVAGVASAFGGGVADGFILVGMGIAAAGIAIFAIFGCIYVTRGIASLIKKGVSVIKRSLAVGGNSDEENN